MSSHCCQSKIQLPSDCSQVHQPPNTFLPLRLLSRALPAQALCLLRGFDIAVPAVWILFFWLRKRMACSHSSGHSLDVTSAGKPSLASLGHPPSFISPTTLFIPFAALTTIFLLFLAGSIHFLLVEDMACAKHYCRLGLQQIFEDWMNDSVKEGSSRHLGSSSFNDFTFKPWIFYMGRIYTTEIGKRYKSMFDLLFCWLSNLSNEDNVMNAGKNSKRVLSVATLLSMAQKTETIFVYLCVCVHVYIHILFFTHEEPVSSQLAAHSWLGHCQYVQHGVTRAAMV